VQTLHWLANPFAELMRLSLPVTVSMLSYSLMTLVDTLIVGQLGKEQLAGVGLGGTWAFLLMSFGFGLTRGGKTLVSQAIGAERREEVGGYLGASLIGGVVFGLVAVLLAWPVGRVLELVSASQAQGHHFFLYLLIRSIGSPIALAANALKEVRYGVGDARSPMVATVIANVVNIGLAYLFVLPLGLGVAGAAWATVLAQVVELGVLALYQTRSGWGTRVMTREHLIAFVRMGIPTGLQMLLEVGAFGVLAAMVAAMSAAQMAGHQITLQMISFSFLPAFAIGESASVMVGQAVGADRDDLVMTLSLLALRTVAAYTALCTIILAVFAPELVHPFTPDLEARSVATLLVRASTLFLVMDGANIVARSVLRGAGDVRFPAWVGVISSWVLTPPLAWLLGFRLHMNAFGGWLGLSGEVFLGATIQWWRLWRGGWRPHAIRSRAEVIALAARDKSA
jgi:MATE family multidrug resistance protein